MRDIRQVIEFQHPQVGDGDEALSSPDALCGGIRLLQRAFIVSMKALVRPWSMPAPCHSG